MESSIGTSVFESLAERTSIVVSAYYDIPSKQSKSFYLCHIRRLLKSLKAPLVFFTSEDLLAELQALRPWHLMPKTLFLSFPVSSWTAWSRFDASFWDRQKSRDQEAYHTQMLAAIWYEKRHFVERAVRELQQRCGRRFDHTPFIWCDAGAMRDDAWLPLAQTFGLSEAAFDLCLQKGKSRLLMQGLRPLCAERAVLCSVGNTSTATNTNTNTAGDTASVTASVSTDSVPLFMFPEVCIAGAIIVGFPCAWKNANAIIDGVYRAYDAAGVACTSDQYVLMSAALFRPDAFALVPVQSLPTPDDWFAFLHLLA